MHQGGLLHILTEKSPDLNTSSTAAVNKFRRENQRARPQIGINIGEELATVIISILLSNVTTKEVWLNTNDDYQKDNIQFILKPSQDITKYSIQ